MKTNKNKIRLAESQLHRVIKESVKDVLSGLEHGGCHPYVHELSCIHKSLRELISTIASCEVTNSNITIFRDLLKTLQPYYEKLSMAKKYGFSALRNENT